MITNTKNDIAPTFMKRLKLIIICLCVALCSAAQTQQIIVKTRGTMDSDGKIIHGKALAGVTIEISGGPSRVVSNIDGRCTVSLNDSIYTFSRIEKNGYELVDTAIIGRQMKASSQTLIIIMDTIGGLSSEKYALERKIRVRFQQHQQTQEKEIKSLKELGILTDEEYNKRLNQLHDTYKKNDKLITIWKDVYDKTDFDGIGNLDLEIYQNILSGNYIKADSLIKMKDEPEYQKNKILRLQRESEMANEVFDLANNYYQLSETYRKLQNYEEAAKFLEKRASLDTLNTEWNLDAGMFIIDYLFDKQHQIKALDYLERSIRTCRSEEDNSYLAQAYVYKGNWFFKRGYYPQSYDWYTMADTLYSEDNYSIAYNNEKAIVCVERIAFSYQFMKNPKALELYKLANTLYEKCYPDRKDLIANCHINIGTLYEDEGKLKEEEGIHEEERGKLDEASKKYEEAHKKYKDARSEYEAAIRYLESISSEPLLMARCYNNLGCVNDHLEDYKQALENYQKSLDLYTQIYDQQINSQLEVGYLYNNLAAAYYNNNEPDFQSALKYFTDALNILSLYLDKDHPTIRTLVENIATTNKEMSRD